MAAGRVENWDVVILGAGAAGMMCALEAGKRGRRVLLIDHARAPGEKIRISGGGRCNFTNIHTSSDRFLSANPKFAISALSRYTAQDFIDLVNAHGIAWHEKTLGQLFCDHSAKDIIEMLRREMQQAGVTLRLLTEAGAIAQAGDGFVLQVNGTPVQAASLVIATGGKSIPKMGATGIGYQIAEQFGLKLIDPRPGLVPLTFSGAELDRLKELSGVATDARVSCQGTSFDEAILFTHRGLSGPAVLQISSYWQEGEAITLSLLPGQDVFDLLRSARQSNGRQSVHTALAAYMPKRLAQDLGARMGLDHRLGDQSDKALRAIATRLSAWDLRPAGSEGYRTAEVTLGGVATSDLDARTMAAKAHPNLYFIGEVVDVTGWLGGYNFQWAWSSGWAAGQVA